MSDNATTMEILVVRDDVQLANDLGFRNVVIESDAEQVVKLWNLGSCDTTEASIFHDIQEFSGNFCFSG